MTQTQSLNATKVAVTGFGAALASMGAATSADAAIVELNFSPSSFGATSSADVELGTSSGATVAGSLAVFNSFSRMSFQSSLNGTTSFSSFSAKRLSSRNGLTFAELLFGDAVAGSVLGTSTQVSRGQKYFGFSSADGKLGWFLYDFGTSKDSGTSFVEGYLNTSAGGAINVGQTTATLAPVPGPAALPLLGTGLLAMGAAGIRRRRKELQAA